MILAIVGPTGVGKTKLSINLAKKYNADIISCDSMQIYRKMDIGTSKVTEDEKENVKHYMLDIRDVNEEYSVYDYQKEARKILNDKLKNNKNVIIVGGTGLYLKALLYNYEFTENNNPRKDFSKYTNEELYNMVLKIDKETKIHVNNRQRLESFLNNHDKKYKVSNKILYDTKIIGLTRPRDELYDAINKRVDKMMEEGLEKEARYFYDNNINSKAINTAIAYKELYLYFDKKISKTDAIELIKKRSRNYAKRQYTFFNHQFNVKWFNCDIDDFDNTINEVIDYIKA